jgi:hypothetical protein
MRRNGFFHTNLFSIILNVMGVAGIFTKNLPDYLITVFVFMIGILSFYLFAVKGIYPVFLYYFWLKAIVVDTIRIRKGQSVKMPSLVYWLYGFQFATLWMADDLIYNNPLVRLGNVKKVQTYLLFGNPLLFWFIVEIITSFAILPFTLLKKGVTNKESVDSYLFIDLLRVYLAFIVAVFLNFLLFTLP